MSDLVAAAAVQAVLQPLLSKFRMSQCRRNLPPAAAVECHNLTTPSNCFYDSKKEHFIRVLYHKHEADYLLLRVMGERERQTLMFASFTQLFLTNEHFEIIALSASKDSDMVENWFFFVALSWCKVKHCFKHCSLFFFVTNWKSLLQSPIDDCKTFTNNDFKLSVWRLTHQKCSVILCPALLAGRGLRPHLGLQGETQKKVCVIKFFYVLNTTPTPDVGIPLA
uniref:Uncharacterized protein n=1 Tax=Cucumis melo TaxID=3656 RepID=A0A9I9ELY0_CUCME